MTATINIESYELIKYYEYFTKLPPYECFMLAIHHYRLLLDNVTRKLHNIEFVHSQEALKKEVVYLYGIIEQLEQSDIVTTNKYKSES